MTFSIAQKHLSALSQCVRDVTVHGGFLLSTGETSRYWVPIGKLRTWSVTDTILDILRICLPNFQHETGVETVFVPQFTTTSEDDFPMDFIISQLRSYSIAAKHPLNFCSISFDQHHREVEIPESVPPGIWLGIFAISVHVDMIIAMLDALQRRKRMVQHILVIVERERVTRQRLQQQGVHLVPFVICDEHTGEPTTILDLAISPYTDYHKYFSAGGSI